jgi:hypothetical protein
MSKAEQVMRELAVIRDFLFGEITEASNATDWENALERVDELAACIRHTRRIIDSGAE